jgi:uncharacterized Rmd1/YagE family protein
MKRHTFLAVAFAENFSLPELAAALPEAKAAAQELRLAPAEGGTVFFYSFGAVVFWNVAQERRDAELARLHEIRPGLATAVQREDYEVGEEPGTDIELRDGALIVDRMSAERASVVALTIAQSAAMRYYERIAAGLGAHEPIAELFRAAGFTRTAILVAGMERSGTVPVRTRRLHRFIAEAIGNRNEVLSVLHLLDKPDAVWNDPAMDRIYFDLRAEFDLVDRYRALELKLSSVQDSLELVLDVARDRRLVLLELGVIVLIVFELVLSLWRR